MIGRNKLAPRAILIASFVVASGLLPQTAQADRKWEIGGFIGFQTFADGNRLGIPDDLSTQSLSIPKDSTFFWGARASFTPLSFFVLSRVALEFEAGQATTRFSGTDVDISTLSYRAQLVGHVFGPGPGLRPFVLLGIGGMRGSPSEAVLPLVEEVLDLDTDTDIETHYGIGIKYQLGVSLGLRIDLRTRRVASDSTEDKFELEGQLGAYLRI